MAGALVFTGIALAHSLITGLAVGVLVDPRGGAHALSQPTPGWSVGAVLAVATALLVVAREVWWTPVAARVAAAVVVIGFTVVGAVLFHPGYLLGIGESGAPFDELLVSGAESTGVYVFAAVALTTAAVDVVRGRARKPPSPIPGVATVER